MSALASITRERKGRLPFVAADLRCANRYNMSGYRPIIEQGRNGVLDTTVRSVHSVGPIIWEALRHPGRRVSWYWEEGGHEYEWAAIFDPATCVVITNYARCPNFAHHHRGTTCAVCGQAW